VPGKKPNLAAPFAATVLQKIIILSILRLSNSQNKQPRDNYDLPDPAGPRITVILL